MSPPQPTRVGGWGDIDRRSPQHRPKGPRGAPCYSRRPPAGRVEKVPSLGSPLLQRTARSRLEECMYWCPSPLCSRTPFSASFLPVAMSFARPPSSVPASATVGSEGDDAEGPRGAVEPVERSASHDELRGQRETAGECPRLAPRTHRANHPLLAALTSRGPVHGPSPSATERGYFSSTALPCSSKRAPHVRP